MQHTFPPSHSCLSYWLHQPYEFPLSLVNASSVHKWEHVGSQFGWFFCFWRDFICNLLQRRTEEVHQERKKNKDTRVVISWCHHLQVLWRCQCHLGVVVGYTTWWWSNRERWHTVIPRPEETRTWNLPHCVSSSLCGDKLCCQEGEGWHQQGCTSNNYAAMQCQQASKPQLAFTEQRDSSKVLLLLEKRGTTTVGTCFQKPFSPVFRRATNTCSLEKIHTPWTSWLFILHQRPEYLSLLHRIEFFSSIFNFLAEFREKFKQLWMTYTYRNRPLTWPNFALTIFFSGTITYF